MRADDRLNWRLVIPGEAPVLFGTEDGARVSAALRMARDPRGPLPVVQRRTGARDIWRNADPPARVGPASRGTRPAGPIGLSRD